MTLFSSLYTGVSGLNAQSQRLGTISDNIANVNTVGYKRAETKFTTFVTQQTTTRFSPGGVLSRPFYEIANQGTLAATLNVTDLAISGGGFFVVNESPTPTIGDEFFYTRAGSFVPDAQGNLVNTAGYYLQAWKLDENGNLPLNNSSLVSLQTVNVAEVTGRPSPTTSVEIGINLPAGGTVNPLVDSSIPSAIQTTDVVVFDSLGFNQTLRLAWHHVSQGDPVLGNRWHLVVQPQTGGSVVNVNDANGVPLAAANTLNNPDPAALGDNYLIVTFNNDGSLQDVVDPGTGDSVMNVNDFTVQVSFDFSSSGANPAQTINFDFGRRNTTAPFVAENVTSYDADYFTTFLNQNGVRFGSYVGVNISDRGVVTAIFDNGQTLPLYQIPLVDFANPNGLEPRTGNAYAQTERAGDFILRTPGSGSAGKVVASSVELSTVDIATEFTDMIITQRAYSANTRVVRTADDMLNDLIQVVR
jgi:flagellar hook protein FlgE